MYCSARASRTCLDGSLNCLRRIKGRKIRIEWISKAWIDDSESADLMGNFLFNLLPICFGAPALHCKTVQVTVRKAPARAAGTDDITE